MDNVRRDDVSDRYINLLKTPRQMTMVNSIEKDPPDEMASQKVRNQAKKRP